MMLDKDVDDILIRNQYNIQNIYKFIFYILESAGGWAGRYQWGRGQGAVLNKQGKCRQVLYITPREIIILKREVFIHFIAIFM